MITVLLVLAGGVGAAARFVLDGELRRWWGASWPWATVAINVTGSALLGAVLAAVDAGADDGWRLVVGVGFCGGFTTFSTASVEAVRLAQQGRVSAAVGAALGPLLLSVGAAAGAYGVVSVVLF